MEIRLATTDDLEAIVALYDAAREFMHSHGNPTQWVGAYPGLESARDDIANGCLHVCEQDGEILGCMALVPGPDPTYAHIEGAWLDDLPYHAIHRIAAKPKGKGVGRAMIGWAVERCGSVRSDTHEDNAPMQHALMACGFEHCGTIYLEDGSPRMAFQLRG